MKIRMATVRFWATVILTAVAMMIFPMEGYAYGWLPQIWNIGGESGCGATTWGVATYDDWAFFANEKGLLVSDGCAWNVYPLDNRSEARCVALFQDEKRVYVGGENEFGYFSPGDTGALRYTCLSDSLPTDMRDFGNVFDIYRIHGAFYYRADEKVVVVNDGVSRVIPSPDKIFASAVWHDRIYIGTATHGLMMLAGDGFMDVAGCEELKGARISSMIPYRKGLLIALAAGGRMYYYDGDTLSRFDTPASGMLEKDVVNCIAANDSLLAIGTIHHGLIVTDTYRGAMRVYNEFTGMQSNTVMSLAFDASGNLWAGLNRGIDFIEFSARCSRLYRSPLSAGIGYAALHSGGRLYLGTDRGLYAASWPVTFSERQADLVAEDIPSGPVWALARTEEGSVLCFHDKGIYELKGDRAERVTGLTGVWSYARAGRDCYIVGGYTGAYLLRKEGGEWVGQRIEGISGGVRYMRYSEKGRQLTVYNPVAGESITYRLSASLRSAVPGSRGGIGDFKVERWNVEALPGGFSVVPGLEGFMLEDSVRFSAETGRVSIRRMSVIPADSVVYEASPFGGEINPEIPYSWNSVRFEFSVVPHSMAQEVVYQSRLNGGEWTPASATPVREFTDLREGNYLFEVRALFPDGTEAVDSMEFRVKAPWYRSLAAWCVYVVLVLCAVFGGIWLERKRVRRSKAKEMKSLKDEIDVLEQEKLDAALRHKSQELANSMLNLGRKNEILVSIKEDLKACVAGEEVKDSAEIRRRLTVLAARIDENIQSDDIFRRFEEEFDLINDNYIKNLSAQYPELRRNELLLAAYLKMELSSKEIAPLLGISVRGVESMRYRLRRKMGLSRNDGTA